MEKEELEPKKDEVFWDKFPSNPFHWIALTVVVVLIFWVPWAVTKKEWFTGIDFTKTGGIGDTINGITAPIIGLFGSFLIFFSFKAQNRANRIQIIALRTQMERLSRKDNYDNLLALFREVEEQFEKIHGKAKLKEFTEKLNAANEGYNANMDFTENFKEILNEKEYIESLATFLRFFLLTLDKLYTSSYYDQDREILELKIKIIYNDYLFRNITTIESVIMSKYDQFEQSAAYMTELYHRIYSLHMTASDYWEHY